MNAHGCRGIESGRRRGKKGAEDKVNWLGGPVAPDRRRRNGFLSPLSERARGLPTDAGSGGQTEGRVSSAGPHLLLREELMREHSLLLLRGLQLLLPCP